MTLGSDDELGAASDFRFCFFFLGSDALAANAPRASEKEDIVG